MKNQTSKIALIFLFFVVSAYANENMINMGHCYITIPEPYLDKGSKSYYVASDYSTPTVLIIKTPDKSFFEEAKEDDNFEETINENINYLNVSRFYYNNNEGLEAEVSVIKGEAREIVIYNSEHSFAKVLAKQCY